MVQLLFAPPIVVILFSLLGAALTYGVSSLGAVGKVSQRKQEAYACGQRNVTHSVSPDYSQFYPYAFFFSVMHVLVLVIATAPAGSLTLPLLYVAAGVLALVIIFRR